MSWIELGVIAKPHGVRGEVRVHVFNPESTLLQELAEVFLIGEEDEEPALVAIESTRQGPERAADAAFADVRSREDAEALRGYKLCVPRDALPELEEGEYYHADLIGLDAVEGDEAIGKVSEVHRLPERRMPARGAPRRLHRGADAAPLARAGRPRRRQGVPQGLGRHSPAEAALMRFEIVTLFPELFEVLEPRFARQGPRRRAHRLAHDHAAPLHEGSTSHGRRRAVRRRAAAWS